MSRVPILALFACLPLPAVSLKQAVIGSQHDLTVAGSGPVKSAEINTCVFCHAPHNITPNVTPRRTAVRYPAGPMPATLPIQPPKPADQYNVRLKFMSSIGHNVMGSSVVTTANTSLRPFMLNVDGVTNNTALSAPPRGSTAPIVITAIRRVPPTALDRTGPTAPFFLTSCN